MSYDEQIRDPELRSRLAEEGLSDDVVSMILLETVRQFFMTVENFTSRRMRTRVPPMLWSADVAETRVRIVRAEDWNPLDMGATPEIVIVSQGSMWKPVENGGEMDAGREEVDDPTSLADLIVGRSVIWGVSTSPSEARAIGWELGMFFSAFSRPLMEEYGFTNLRPGGVGGPVHIAERKGYWGVPLTLAYSWQQTQELLEQQPRIAEIMPDVGVD